MLDFTKFKKVETKEAVPLADSAPLKYQRVKLKKIFLMSLGLVGKKS